jgi:hypothetical protein
VGRTDKWLKIADSELIISWQWKNLQINPTSTAGQELMQPATVMMNLGKESWKVSLPSSILAERSD